MLDFSFFYAHFYDIPYKRYDFLEKCPQNRYNQEKHSMKWVLFVILRSKTTKNLDIGSLCYQTNFFLFLSSEWQKKTFFFANTEKKSNFASL